MEQGVHVRLTFIFMVNVTCFLANNKTEPLVLKIAYLQLLDCTPAATAGEATCCWVKAARARNFENLTKEPAILPLMPGGRMGYANVKGSQLYLSK